MKAVTHDGGRSSRGSESSASLKNILHDILNNNIDEERKILLLQQDNVEETVGNQITFR